MKDIQQLIKKNSQEERYEDIFPKTFIDAIKDKESGVSLQEILQGFNMYFLSYNGSKALTRCKIPTILRKEGLWITYVLYDHTVVTEWYNSNLIDDNSWGMDSNWRVASNSLVGDISISADGYWVINGLKTEAKAQGETGDTPRIRVGSNNKLQVSYNNKSWEDVNDHDMYYELRISGNKLQQSNDLGKTWHDISDYIASRFRINNNKLEQSVDLGQTWTVLSDYIASWFRFTGTAGSSQVDNVGKIQISRDNGTTWSDLSGEFTNSLYIKGYVATVGTLPSSAVQGDIYGVGPTYDPSDTAQTNPIYQLYVKDSTGWVNNGKFTSIAAGVVQTTGTSTTEVMSQDAVSKEFASVLSEQTQVQNKTLNIDYINYPFAISDINGNIVYLVDFGGIINNDELEGIYSNIDSLSTLLNGFFNCNYPFAVADSNGNVAFLVSYEGATINNENKEFEEKLNFRINSEIAINSEVVSPLNFIHAFSVSAVSKNGGDIFFIYMASNVNVDEHYTSDTSWIELSKFNICKPSETTDIQVIKHGDVFDGVTVYNPYNMLVTKSVDESIIYCHFGCIPAGETTPVYATIPVNPSTLEKGTFQQNTLTYSVNGIQKTVKYSMDNYLTMLYELGLTDSKIEYGYDRKTTDNSIPYFYNGKFYKVESHSADTILPIILVSSVDMINWEYEKVIASGFKADELSLVIKDDIIYVSFRQDGGDGMRYYVYDSNNDVELASGRFENGILSRPMTFLYKNEVYMIINTKPAYYGNTSVPTFDLANRQEVSIFKVVNNIPSLIGKMTNPNGINYHYELPFRGTPYEPYGDFIGEESLYMFFSEDRRKIWQVRQFSDIAFCDITNILNIK